jgi:16S rRNA C967 or C1407 C5-methylase (RsmB/RsmF family)
LRAISITKVGGLILYSTCSINPIEDEAVITEVFRRCNYEALELVDLHHKLPGLKARRGLTHWPVLQLMPHVLNSHSENPDITAQDAFTIYQSYEDYL